MVLEDSQILDILKKPQNEYISEWQEQHATLDLFVNGGDVTRKLEQVKNFENADQKRLRDKIARSTKDLTSYLFKPLDKVFSASGTNIEVEATTDRISETISDYLDELPNGISLSEWMQTTWKDAYITDPNGIIYVESDMEGNSYPTYKSIMTVHDYVKKWDQFEYIVFAYDEIVVKENGKEETKTIYRVIDDEKDGLYWIQNDTLNIYEGDDKTSIIYHELGFVPAINPSNIPDKHTGGKRSLLFPIDEILEEYMRDSSVHSIYKFLHGFPVKWQYATKCTTCSGTGKITDKNSPETPKAKVKCPTCHGTGIKKTNDVSDGITLPIPKADQPKLAPDLAGFVQPALETWGKQVEELDRMKHEMHFSLWGTLVEEEKSNTATGRFIDAQPVNDSLDKISKCGETIQGKLIEFIGMKQFPEQYQDNICKWGRRYLVETPDVLWNKYLTAKEKQAPITTLDYLYKQYLMVEYHNDLAMMQRKLKEFNLEPYPHYSLMDLDGKATVMQIQKKILFSEWNAEADYTKEINVLKQEFESYVTENYTKTEIS